MNISTVGIPRALFYWKRPYFWEEFLKGLGIGILLSPPTNKKIVEMGVMASDSETCFSTKVLFGHILSLEKKVDCIFVPRLKTNHQKLEYCPKFFALPDLAKILTKTSILTETFDSRKEEFQKTLRKFGKRLVKSEGAIERAINLAFLKEKESKEKEAQEFFKKLDSKRKKIVLVSHPYNLYDDYVNLGVKKKLEDLGTEPIFIDEVPISESQDDLNCIPKFHWEFGKEIMKKIETILNYDISGAIEISSFQCGCDAVLKEFVEKEFKDKKIPFLYLMIDEHTGEAGIKTRLEAFCDTL